MSHIATRIRGMRVDKKEGHFRQRKKTEIRDRNDSEIIRKEAGHSWQNDG